MTIHSLTPLLLSNAKLSKRYESHLSWVNFTHDNLESALYLCSGKLLIKT
jgi:hypothetical protein